MIGDQPRTDGRLAERLGIAFGLVDSGVTPAGVDTFDVPVGLRAPDLVGLVRSCLGSKALYNCLLLANSPGRVTKWTQKTVSRSTLTPASPSPT